MDWKLLIQSLYSLAKRLDPQSPELIYLVVAGQKDLCFKLDQWSVLLRTFAGVLSREENKKDFHLDDNVIMWLDDVQNSAADLEDIVDEIAHQALDLKLMVQSHPITGKKSFLKNLLSFRCFSGSNASPVTIFDDSLRSKIIDASYQLEKINMKRKELGLRPDLHTCVPYAGRMRPNPGLPKEAIYGRDKDKTKILEMLLREEASDVNFSMIPIVGPAGIGKTTLARLVYDDESVKDFKPRAWVSFSEDSDVLRISKAILESIASNSCNLKDLNEVLLHLKEAIIGSKFLLVFDDVSSKNYGLLEILNSTFMAGAPGSKIIVTTHSIYGAFTIHPNIQPYKLEVLSDKAIWSVFATYAFDQEDNGAYQDSKLIRQKVFDMCKGLPLAAGILGGFLRFECSNEWEGILNNKICDLAGDNENCEILPVLNLSYHHLPSYLKRYFAYCAIFPKDYEFEEKDLVLLWMAEGLMGAPLEFEQKINEMIQDRETQNKLAKWTQELWKDGYKSTEDEQTEGELTKDDQVENELTSDDQVEDELTKDGQAQDKLTVDELTKDDQVEKEQTDDAVTEDYRVKDALSNDDQVEDELANDDQVEDEQTYNELTKDNSVEDELITNDDQEEDELKKDNQVEDEQTEDDQVEDEPTKDDRAEDELTNHDQIEVEQSADEPAKDDQLEDELDEVREFVVQEQVEDKGGKFFRDLLRRSLFQHSSSHVSKFRMHDLVKNMAKWISRETDFGLENVWGSKEQLRRFKRAGHSNTYASCGRKNKLETFYEVENLRTFLPGLLLGHDDTPCIDDKFLLDLLPKFKRLRVLSLEKQNITELPNSVEGLRYLRYVNLSNTMIQRLPDSICSLLILQILLLRDCSCLMELPSNLRNLINLRHLDITGINLIKEMPLGIKELKCLRALLNFIVGKGTGSDLKDLKNLKFLRELHISRLHNVTCSQDQKKDSLLVSKKRLNVLLLEWGSQLDATRNELVEENVLDTLQPHKNLRELTIKGYGGTKFSSWVGNPSYSNMEVLTLERCERCTNLPSLGHLGSLKHLTIKGMTGIKRIGSEIFGTDCSSPFKSLEILCFEDLQEWEQWDPVEQNEHVEIFPRVYELFIVKCPKLNGKLPEQHLSSLKKLTVQECGQLVIPFSSLPGICEAEVHGHKMLCGSQI